MGISLLGGLYFLLLPVEDYLNLAEASKDVESQEMGEVVELAVPLFPLMFPFLISMKMSLFFSQRSDLYTKLLFGGALSSHKKGLLLSRQGN